MPDILPSVLKPKDKGANLSATKGMSTEAKARKYDDMRPGTKISDAQKAERIDLMRFRDENGIISQRRKTSVGTITVPSADIWDENGKLKP